MAIEVSSTRQRPDHHVSLSYDHKNQAAIDQLPLPFRGSRKIIGHGGYSVAIRINDHQSECDTQVAVLRIDTNSVREHAAMQPLVRRFLPHHTQDQHVVIAEGWDNLPLNIKVSKEVTGSTLADHGALYSLINPRLRKNTLRLALEITNAHRQGGFFIDMAGRQCNSLAERLRVLTLPLHNSNIVVSDNNFQPILVDSEIDPPRKHKRIRTHIRETIVMSGLNFSILGLAAIDLIDSKLRKPENESNQLSKEDAIFTEKVAQTLKLLDQEEVDYVVVGSVALTAWRQFYGEKIKLGTHRLNRSLRDIDIIVIPDQKYENFKLRVEREQLDLSIASFGEAQTLSTYEKRQDKRLGGRYKFMHTVPVTEDGRLKNAYKDITLDICALPFKHQLVMYNGVHIKTLSPEDLAGLYLTRGGAIKFKDGNKVSELLRLSGRRIPIKYIDYAREIKTRYPHDFKNFLIHELYIAVRQKIGF